MPFYNVRFQGSLPAGDMFMFGWWADSSEGVGSIADLAESWIDDLWTAVLGDLYTTSTDLTAVIVGQYDSITGAQQARAERSMSLAGTVDPTVTAPLPPDVACVVSLQTDLANRRGRGRFYLPAFTSGELTDDGRIPTGTRDDIATNVASGFGLFNAAASPGLIVASRANDAGTVVQRIAVGDIYDTQRRRDNSLVEARSIEDI